MSAKRLVIAILAFGLLSVPGIVGQDYGYPFHDDTFGLDPHDNTFGLDPHDNTFGPDPHDNTFGPDPHDNTFGLDPYDNTFGLDPHDNTFGLDPHDNTFGPGPYTPDGPYPGQSPSGEDYTSFYITESPPNAESMMDLGYASDVPSLPEVASSSYEPDVAMILEQQSVPVSSSPGYERGMAMAQQVGSFGQQYIPNQLWIVDAYGQRRSSITMPLYRWAREEIIPAVSGELVIYERYPSGHVERYYPGHVTRGRMYQMWFYADTLGRHDVIYSIHTSRGWYNSNRIWFDVYRPWRSWNPWGPGPYRGSTGISMSSHGGTTRMISSDGDISISTSASWM